MAVPANIVSDMTALDTAIINEQDGAAKVVVDEAALAKAQSDLAASQAADAVNQQSTNAAKQQLDADLAAWVATGTTPTPTPTMSSRRRPR